MQTHKRKTKNEILTKLDKLEELLRRRSDKPLTFQEAVGYLGISKSYLYKLTAQKKIPSYKPQGKLIYFNRVELNEWVYRKSRQKAVGHANWRASSRQKGQKLNVKCDPSTPKASPDKKVKSEKSKVKATRDVQE